ncbi:MAG: sulfate ABC transporter ATP-binding protein [Rhizobiales bacterium PAR1]|nr:MAG: sulfate ABC transporter ATP-binding protein [Rhizobiales bacterium PAR1]
MSIRVEGITKHFGQFAALSDVTLDFDKGKLVALLGPSGCGKTTLLRIIAGLETADHGRVLFDEEDATERHVRERQVGFVFQHYALFRHMSVFENVAFGLRVKPRKERPGEAEIRRRVMKLLDLVQLAWVADRSPLQLSGGQRQRIALARALAVEPQVLLLDEPFGALDAKVRKELRSWLRQLHDELHVTSIFVTHDQEEALELADEVVLMNRGRIEQIGSPTEVYTAPASAFVYGFLGSSNQLFGEVKDGYLDTLGARVALPTRETVPQRAAAFVRPHDLHIERGEGHGVPATVRRILTLGALARIELSAVQDSRAFEVELPLRDLSALALTQGETVRLVPTAMRLFPIEEAASP